MMDDREFDRVLEEELTQLPVYENPIPTEEGQRTVLNYWAAELNLKALAAASGNKHVEMVHLKEVFPLTGYIRGGCSPLAAKKPYPVFVDDSAAQHARIYVSAGQRGVQLHLAPAVLQQAAHAVLAPLCRAQH